MIAPVYAFRLAKIIQLRVRKSWSGKLILQVRRRRESRDPTPISREGGFRSWREIGCSEWCDANGKDLTEVAEIVNLFGIISEGGTKNPISSPA